MINLPFYALFLCFLCWFFLKLVDGSVSFLLADVEKFYQQCDPGWFFSLIFFLFVYFVLILSMLLRKFWWIMCEVYDFVFLRCFFLLFTVWILRFLLISNFDKFEWMMSWALSSCCCVDKLSFRCFYIPRAVEWFC